MTPLSTVISSTCCLCSEIATGKFHSAYQRAYPLETRICLQTLDFVVLPSVSPLSVGHVLVLPKIHVGRLADLPQPARKALSVCAHDVTVLLGKRFEMECYCFEHGVVNGVGACGIDHAHLHILPLTPPVASLIDKRADADFPVHAGGSLTEVLALGTENKDRCYLLRGSGLDAVRLSFDDRISSQYMRRVIAGALGLASWDWKLLFGWQDFLATREAFGPINDHGLTI
jgi:diadenosine tetraphosphate (Ap4A) HIT family hydrolase